MHLRDLKFVKDTEGLSIEEVHKRIAEREFRRPIVIFNVAMRPFWRDGRKAPSLKEGLGKYELRPQSRS